MMRRCHWPAWAPLRASMLRTHARERWSRTRGKLSRGLVRIGPTLAFGGGIVAHATSRRPTLRTVLSTIATDVPSSSDVGVVNSASNRTSAAP